MPNKRISELQEKRYLFTDLKGDLFPTRPFDGNISGESSAQFLLAEEKKDNYTIEYKKLKTSIIDHCVFMTGEQLISGDKVFADPCTFLSRMQVNEVIDFTPTGDINAIAVVGKTGLLENLRVGQPFYNRELDSSTYNLHTSGQVLMLGDSRHTGHFRQQGNYLRIGESTQIGSTFISGDKTYTEDIYADEKIIHLYDEDTFTQLNDESINFTAGGSTKIDLKENSQEILFHTNDQNQAQINDTGFLSINNTSPIGELSVSGKAFVENIYRYDHFYKTFYRVYGGDSETVSFKHEIRPGNDEYKINLPKTFFDPPIISLNLEGHGVIPISKPIIKNLTEFDLNIKFPSVINSKGYSVHVTALETSFKKGNSDVHYEKYPHVSCEDAGSNRLAIQRFKTTFSNSGLEFKIDFPIEFGSAPIVSTTIEGIDTNVEYAIFSVNKSSYSINFSKEVNNFTVHTFSSISGYKGF